MEESAESQVRRSRAGRRCLRLPQLGSGEGVRRPGMQPRQEKVVSPRQQSPKAVEVREHQTRAPSKQDLRDALPEREISRQRSAAGDSKDIGPLYPKITSKKGTEGTEITLTTNYFRVERAPDWCLYQYLVEFSPEEDRNHIKKLLIRQNKEALGNYIFDGTVLFSARLYDTNTLNLHSFNEAQRTEIKLLLVSKLESNDPHYIHLYNLLMRGCLEALNLNLVGRYYYEPGAKMELRRNHLELWPGYVTSIRHHEHDLLLCTEVTHKVMRMETVYDIFHSVSKNSPKHELQATFGKSVLGTIVLTDYNNRTYRVDDIDYSVTPASRFNCGDKTMSYGEYYLTKYRIIIQHMDQPMLVTRPKKKMQFDKSQQPIHLVPELCRMTGLSDKMRANFTLMKDLADKTRMNPSQRIERLRSFNHKLYNSTKVVDQLDSWNLKLQERLVTLPGRVLPDEKIIFGNKVTCSTGPYNDWTKQMKESHMLSIAKVPSWAVIVPSSQLRAVQSFVKCLREAALSMNMILPAPVYQQIHDDNLTSYITSIHDSVTNDNPSILLVVLPNNSCMRYGAIKKKCLTAKAVVSQLILSKTLSSTKNMMSIATKVAIQMNCKLGGAPWTVEIPMSNFMVIGFDVYHESSKQKQSVGVLVASLDKQLTQYFTAVSHHHTGEDLSDDFPATVCKAVRRYQRYNSQLPKTIIIYRDGVGEGQIPYVQEHEVKNLQSQLGKLYDDQQFQMAFILVTKRINTRFFYNRTNPPPGTVVDDVVTLPNRHDFYLVSQSVHQGTVSPTSYNIIYSDLRLTPGQIQRLTYKLTHLYYNWSGTVRVPAPVQYAHKLAYLIGQTTHAVPSIELQDLLYFL